MHIEIVDVLRCLSPHEETWLVVSIDSWDGRHLQKGNLRCPLCHADYPITAGVADFRDQSKRDPESLKPDGGTRSTNSNATTLDENTLVRVAAQLDLRESGGIILMGPALQPLAVRLATMAELHCVVLNGEAAVTSDLVSHLHVDSRLPLAASALRGAAIDVAVYSPSLMGDLVRAIRPGGRLVAPSSVPVPHGIQELARDDWDWVGEWRGGSSGHLISLVRG